MGWQKVGEWALAFEPAAAAQHPLTAPFALTFSPDRLLSARKRRGGRHVVVGAGGVGGGGSRLGHRLSGGGWRGRDGGEQGRQQLGRASHCRERQGGKKVKCGGEAHSRSRCRLSAPAVAYAEALAVAPGPAASTAAEAWEEAWRRSRATAGPAATASRHRDRVRRVVWRGMTGRAGGGRLRREKRRRVEPLGAGRASNRRRRFPVATPP